MTEFYTQRERDKIKILDYAYNYQKAKREGYSFVRECLRGFLIHSITKYANEWKFSTHTAFTFTKQCLELTMDEEYYRPLSREERNLLD